MIRVSDDKRAELVRIAKGRQPTIDQADDLAEADVAGVSAQFVAALIATYAIEQTSMLEVEQDQLKKLRRKVSFLGNIPNGDSAFFVVPCTHHDSLQSIESFLRDLHAFAGSILSPA